MPRKTEVVAIRLEPELVEWLRTYEQNTGKTISEILRDWLWNSYRVNKQEGRVKKMYEKRTNVYRKKISELSLVLSNPQNTEVLVQTIIGLERTFESWGVHFKGLERMLTGKKGVKKPRPKNGVRQENLRAEEKKP